ncbi:MAG: hypothetical protein R3D89_00730 [Sphingomonadaceae bacterium]
MSDLDAAAMLDRAKAETGLSDWADPGFSERFALAVDHIEKIPMDAAGRAAARENIHWLLTDRLKFFQDRKDYPLAEEVIDRPLFATGEPRSGTTLMHALMSVDPDARALRFWEVMHPSPPPGIVAGDDRRAGRCRVGRDQHEDVEGLHCHPTTTCSAMACPRTSAAGRSISG